MNILPKKSWHVRNKQNIERVRKDEAKAAEEEKERQRRIALAESEARTELLRNRAAKRKRDDDDDPVQERRVSTAPTEHINFFKDEQEGKQTGGTNADYEAEKKAEKEKEEKAIGLLTYLGQSSIEAQNSKPWYDEPVLKRQKLSEKEELNKTFKEEFDLKHKWGQDPMKQMSLYLRQKEKIEKRDKQTTNRAHTTPFTVDNAAETTVRHAEKHQTPGSSNSHKKKKQKHKEKHKDKHKSKKHKKHHKKHRSREETPAIVASSSSNRSSTTLSSSGKTIQQLRAERLKREREEKHKSEQLMASLHGNSQPNNAEEVVDERDRKYNSQYNPDFVRRKRKKDFSLEL